MKEFEDLLFEEFSPSDVELMTPIMRRAFDEDARRHLQEPSGGPEGYDNGDFLRRWALNADSHAYKVSKNNRPVGAIIVWVNENNENVLGNIFVDPDLQNQGLGTVIWRFIEAEYPDTIIWRTDTPGFSKRNHHFYVNKCGFKITRIDYSGDRYKESYLMEKTIPETRRTTARP
jgi:GNAT superfamily N-acetyltransferase